MNQESISRNRFDFRPRQKFVVTVAVVAVTLLSIAQDSSAQDPFALPAQTKPTAQVDSQQSITAPSITAPAIPFTSPAATTPAGTLPTSDSQRPVTSSATPAFGGPPALSADAFQGDTSQGITSQADTSQRDSAQPERSVSPQPFGSNRAPDSIQPSEISNTVTAEKTEAQDVGGVQQEADSHSVAKASAQRSELTPMEKAMEQYYDRPPFVSNPRPVARLSNDPAKTSALKPNTTPVTNMQPANMAPAIGPGRAGTNQDFQPQGGYQRESSPPPAFGQQNGNPVGNPVGSPSPQTNNFNNATEISFDNARTLLIHNIEVPATSMGPISAMNIEENDLVDKGQSIAVINDEEATRILQSAKLKYELALTRSQNITSIEMAATKVKLATSEFATTNRLYVKGSKTKQEAERARYSKEIAEYELIEAREAVVLARLEAQTELVNYHAARESLERHRIKSPISGIVYETLRDEGEWANRGDVVVKVGNLEQLHVHTTLSIEQYAPHIVEKKRVVVTTTLGGQAFQFSGEVARVGIETEGTNSFRVIIKVDNEKENGNWILKPGMYVEGRIQLNNTVTSAIPAAVPSATSGSLPPPVRNFSGQ